ncbi:endo-1,4-beta-xylanase [Asticcacaulis sp. ZE23SCel15]|uniref:endo-1,4-beta-xylanase n=1 Tax=Asticcacaulis sp. ZE23SCel15 TaxID=3059027 RepID=UPI0026601C3D|nr:endo-1,4-beta-xylanase [Asticcacaulis sp. ZE23SCel15]WKL57780.1 endo-1,4-beta-xylanase [Asticcacaulis sp. ZE23SCel15]
MISRRAVLTGAVALAGCGQSTASPQGDAPLPPLKSLAPFDLGVCAMTASFKDPQWGPLAATHFDRITPEWEMKMEYILQPDGSLRFGAPDAVVDFAHARGMSVFGHVIIWYAQDGDYFQKLKGDKRAFGEAYRAYVRDVAAHYRSKVMGWDVVNEPMLDDGSGLRDCLWMQMMGEDYVAQALRSAHAAAPNVPLFLNDYNLEYYPKKRAAFLRLAERLLKAGVPLHGLGTQTHIDATIAPGMLKAAITDIASLGLKVHVSEVDISLKPEGMVMPGTDLPAGQIQALEEITDAYLQLKPHQQFGMTVWGLRDKDTFPYRKDSSDKPVLFDSSGFAKPLAHAFAGRFSA